MRVLHDFERPLVGYLLEAAGIIVNLDAIAVKPMADGGMGSLAIAPFGNHEYGSCSGECYFYDSDGVLVLVQLNLDKRGVPFEVDLWKVDFSPLATWPTREQIRVGTPDR